MGKGLNVCRHSESFFFSIVKSGSSTSTPVTSPSLKSENKEQNSAAAIATEYSLATNRETPNNTEHGLDLSVTTDRQEAEKQTFNYTLRTADDSLSDDSNQPLDLSSKHLDDNQIRAPESMVSGRNVMLGHAGNLAPISTPQGLTHNTDNFPGAYTSCYGPGMGMVPNEVPDPSFITSDPSRVMSPDERSMRLTSPPSAANQLDSDLGVINPNISYSDFMNDLVKHQLSPSTDSSPESVKSLLQNLKYEVNEQEQKKSLPKYFRMSEETMSTTAGQKKTNAKKKCNEMKIISENTSYPGVYTSVLKLPWSRRSRSRKGLKQVPVMKQEPVQPVRQVPAMVPESPNIIIPDASLQQPDNTFQQMENYTPNPDSPTLMPIKIPQTPSLNPNPDTSSSQSVMMVYPNSAYSALGKPVRKRGRPPKLPMLAKLLQNSSKKQKKGKTTENNPVQEQVTQQIQMNGGMLLYNANGQVVTAMGGMSMPTIPVPVPMTMEQGQTPAQSQGQAPMIPNLSQAQFIGQFQLQPQINAAGQLQFVGPTPAQLQSLQVQGQVAAASQEQMSPSSPSSDNESPSEDIQVNQETMPTPIPAPVPIQLPVGYNYAMPPMLFPMPPMNTEATAGNQPTDPNQLEDRVSSLGMTAGDTHVMTHVDTNTISTMSTTSVSNTGSGSIYQEMILSSKSLKEYKPRKRRTTIQQLKAKASDQNFLCTSFRIRPRLVAQAQAQRERLAAKCMKNINEIQPDSKNLNGPQNDTIDHFGDNSDQMSLYDSQMMSLNNLQIKRELVDDELYGQLSEYGITSDHFKIQTQSSDKVDNVPETDIPMDDKRFTPAKHFTSRRAKNKTFLNKSKLASSKPSPDSEDNSIPAESYHGNSSGEMSHCNICNEIVPADKKESHWKGHVPMCYICKNCGMEFQNQNSEANENQDPLHCDNCHGDLVKTEMEIPNSRNVFSKVRVDENVVNRQTHPYETRSQHGYECEVCSKKFDYFHALQFHRKMHKERKIDCAEVDCEMKFRTIKEMEKHCESHHPSSEKKEYYYCTYDRCKKKFLKNFHLQEHVRVKHLKIKAFQCPWEGCTKEFAAERHMKVHLLIHKNEKPIHCEYCDYRCRQRSALNWHMRKHPDMPYPFKRFSSDSPTLSAQESE